MNKEKTHVDAGIHLQKERYRSALEQVLKLLQARRPYTPGLGAPINIIKSVLEQEGEK